MADQSRKDRMLPVVEHLEHAYRALERHDPQDHDREMLRALKELKKAVYGEERVSE